MKIDEHSFREEIYDRVSGMLEREGVCDPELEWVKSEFIDGSYCDLAYGQILEAYSRLCRRLGTAEWEDPDAEVIINHLLSIGKHLSLKMFEYGVLFARRSAACPTA